MTALVLVVIAWVACGVAASLIQQHRGGDAAAGFVWGALLGLVGVVVVTVKSNEPRQIGEGHPIVVPPPLEPSKRGGAR